MLYELRQDVTGFSPVMNDAWEAFVSGDTTRAAQTVRELDATHAVLTAQDRLLASDILTVNGDLGGLEPHITAGLQTAPGHPWLQVAKVRSAISSGRLLQAERELALVDRTIDRHHPCLTNAIGARIYSLMGREKTAQSWLDAVRTADPFARMFAASALDELRDWDAAKSLLQPLVDEFPRWTRPQLMLGMAELALGESNAGYRRIAAAANAFPCDLYVAQFAAGIDYAAGRIDEAGRRLEMLLHGLHAEHSGFKFALPLRLRVLMRQGQREKALEIARDVSPEFADYLAEQPYRPEGKVLRVPVEPVVQQRDMCVAASIAMALRPLGIPVEPARAYAEMKGRRGVSPWNMDPWLEAQGVTPRFAKQSLDALKAGLDLGAPALVVRGSSVASHMELLVGYDDVIGEFEMYDPMQGLPHHVPYEAFDDELQAFDEAPVFLFAGATRDNADRFPSELIDQDSALARQILRLVAAGETEEAIELHAKADRDAFPIMMLELKTPHVFLREDQKSARLVEIARRPEASATSKLNIIGQLKELGETAEAARIALDFPTLSPVEGHFRAALGHWANREWVEMTHECSAMLEEAADVGHFWWLNSVALSASSQEAQAAQARLIALEIEPEHLEANVDRLRYAERAVDLQTELTVLQDLLEHHPSVPFLRSEVAQVQERLGHYDQALKTLEEGRRRAPMSSQAHQLVQNYWLASNRPDLAEAVGMPEGARANLTGGDGEEDSELDSLMRTATAEDSSESVQARRVLRSRIENHELTSDEELGARAALVAQLANTSADGELDIPLLRRLLPASLPLPRAGSWSWFMGQMQGLGGTAFLRELLAWSQHIVPLDERSTDFHLNFALTQAQSGYVSDADQEFMRLASEFQDVRAIVQLGYSALERRSWAEAADHFQAALEREPGQLATRNQLASAYFALGDENNGMRVLHDLMRMRPYDPQVAEAVFMETVNQSGAEGARAWLKANGDRYEETSREVWKFEILLSEGLVDEANAALSDAARERFPSADASANTALWEQQNSLANHVPELAEYVKLFPDNPRYLELLRQVGGHGSVDSIREVFEKNPTPSSALTLLKSWPREYWPQELAKSAETISNSSSGTGFAIAMRVAMRELQATPYAADFLAWVGQLRPRDVAVMRERIQALLDLGRDSEAVHVAEAALKLDPHDRLTIRNAADAYYNPNRAHAIELLKQHHHITGNPDTLVDLAEWYLTFDERAQALSLLEVALQDSPGAPRAIGLAWYLDRNRPHDRWPHVLDAMRREVPYRCSYFAVAAAHIAKAIGDEVPIHWAGIAATRARALRSMPQQAVGDELQQLWDLQREWYAARDEMSELEDIYPGRNASKRPNRLMWMMAKTGWVPKN